MSGSCNIKTCWRALPPLIEIGQKLLLRYTNAKEINRSLIDIDRNALNLPEKRQIRDQLYYMAKSPDYCTKDEKLGSFGTVGR